MTATVAERPLDLMLVQRATDPKVKLQRAAQLIEQAEAEMEARRLRRNAAAVLLFRRTNAEAIAQGEPVSRWPLQPSSIWRDTIVVSRSLWHKIMGEAEPARVAELAAELDERSMELRQLPDERAAELGVLIREREKLARRLARHQAQVEAVNRLQAELAEHPELDLLAIARSEAAEVHRLFLLIREAKPIRDQLAHDLMNGVYRELYGNVSNSETMKLSKLSSARTTQLRALR
jgi:hypothetical protein